MKPRRKLHDQLALNEQEKKLAAEFQKWRDFLNSVIGVISFSLALGCVGTRAPSTFAGLSLLFVLALRLSGSHFAPSAIRDFQHQAIKDPIVRARLRAMIAKHHPMRLMVTTSAPFTIGFVFLMSVAVAHVCSLVIPATAPFIDRFLGPF